jgi:hypothetical protein
MQVAEWFVHDPVRAAGVARFFKSGPGEYGEGDRFLGLTVPAVRRFVREYQSLPLEEVASLLESPWHEVRLLALLILIAVMNAIIETGEVSRQAHLAGFGAETLEHGLVLGEVALQGKDANCDHLG